MRTRTRTDSPVEQRLDLSWDTPAANTSPVESSSTEAQKPQVTSAAPSEPVSPSSSIETPPASSNCTDKTPSLPPSSANETAVASVSETAKQEPPETVSPTTPVGEETTAPVADEAATPVADEAATPTKEAPQVSSPTEPPSPPLPSKEEEPSLHPQDAMEAKEPSTETPDTTTSTPSLDSSQGNISPADTVPVEPSPALPLENPPASTKLPKKPAPPVNIIPKDDPVGVVLSKKRQEANVKIEDLANRLNINEFVIRYLESGDYEGLGRTFGKNNCVYIIFNFKSIGEELGMTKNEIDDLVEKLNKEITAAGLKLDAPVKHDDDAKLPSSTGRKRPVKSVLPKLIVFTLFIVCILIFFLAVVVPYVTRRRPQTEKRVDFLPLIEQPWKSMHTIPPQQLPIP